MPIQTLTNDQIILMLARLALENRSVYSRIWATLGLETLLEVGDEIARRQKAAEKKEPVGDYDKPIPMNEIHLLANSHIWHVETALWLAPLSVKTKMIAYNSELVGKISDEMELYHPETGELHHCDVGVYFPPNRGVRYEVTYNNNELIDFGEIEFMHLMPEEKDNV